MIPPKIFMRMTDLMAIDARKMSEGDDRSAEVELEKLQESYGWPSMASVEQRQEWDDLYSRIDPSK